MKGAACDKRKIALLAILGATPRAGFLVDATDIESYAIPDIHRNDTTAPIATSDVPTFFMPPGCTCKTSGMVNDEQCEQFDCFCKCDVTAGSCDLNCCCDNECNDEEITSFDRCLDEGYVAPVVKMCVEGTSALEEVNLKYPLRASDSPEDKLHGLMCVEKDNSAVKGDFFQNPGYPKASKVFSPGGRGAKPIGFHSYAEISTENSAGPYQRGDPIGAYRSSDQGLMLAFGGNLVLPTANDGGECIELNAVSFGENKASVCLRHVEDLALECQGRLSSMRYISNIFVKEAKGSVLLGASSSLPTTAPNGGVPIRIQSFTDSSGNEVANLERIPNETLWDESKSTCTNVLSRLSYNVRYNNTKIIGVAVEVETVDIDLSETVVKQEFEVKFVPEEVDSFNRSHSQGNIISRTRSGNPGYIVGKPTLGAQSLNSNSTVPYVIAQKAGFTVMDTGVGGRCSSSSQVGSTVPFANDMYVGCTQSMTREELREFCTSDTHPMHSSNEIGENQFVFPTWLKTTQDLLGIFGNADPLQRRHWIKIESTLNDPDFARKTRSWIESESRCSGMPSRLRFEILWTYAGSVDNPQAKILSAKQSFDDGPSLQHNLPPDEKQPFSFVTTVSWSFLHPGKDLVKKPPPTLIFSVPYDVFYPFHLGHSGVPRTCTNSWAISIIIFIASVMFVQGSL